MKKILLTPFVLLLFLTVYAVKISGTVTDNNGNTLPFSSILIKGTTAGTSANNAGKYFINLEPGTYTVICQHVGYAKQEKTVTITTKEQTLNFQLTQQELVLNDVIVKKGEDPAYEIIRQAIKKRKEYLTEIDKFTCEVYLKGQFALRDYPKKFLGQKVDFEDGDTSKRKIIFLSETIAKYAVDKPNKRKIEVVSTKVSGQSNSFGFSSPRVISFYENNVQIGEGLNPRGFVSPIADGALNFYKYKYEGSFFEDGKQVNQIKVIPRRKYEPLFSGHIYIVEDEWRIHSVKLQLTKESQMQLVDTLNIEQLYFPAAPNGWAIKSQVIYPAIKFFGFDATGNFISVYSKYNLDPGFDKKFFNNTILKFDTGANKKNLAYWESVRPIPLLETEAKDYKKKDSLEQARKDPRYLDSLDKIRNKLTIGSVLLFGKTFSKEKRKESFTINPLIQTVAFNTAEGWNLSLHLNYFKRLDSANPRKTISISPTIRYGFSNDHLNIYSAVNYTYGKKYFSAINIAGGKRIYQFNNANPIAPSGNSISTLIWERNYMKIYEAWFARVNYLKGIGDGLTVSGNLLYQNRMPLENTTTKVWNDRPNREIQPNYPTELLNQNFTRYQALIATATINWQPGSRYIEFPDRKINIGSKYPKFNLSYIQGINNLLGSDIDYSKWKFAVTDDINLKLGGAFSYRFSIGGFLSKNKTEVPDYQHFNGNQLAKASEYLNSFQLAPYYKYSNTGKFYSIIHAEYHLNGLLTNKIPLFRKLNWHLVAGSNAFYVNKSINYIEVFTGIENIFKVLRLDLIWGFEQGKQSIPGFRFGLPLFNSRNED